MISFFAQFFRPWTWRMAWRDTRASRRRLLLFSASIIMGVAALVAIRSFGTSLERTVDLQSRALLGADLSISSRQEITEEEEELFESLGGEQAREVDFSSMIYFPNSGGTRLVQIRAVTAGFPFYGKFETSPPDAESAFRAGEGVFVEESLLQQFNAQPGDPVRLGKLTTRVAGSLVRAPGASVAMATLSPRVYMAMDKVAETGLLREGSLARYKAFFKFPEGTDVRALVRTIRPQLQQNRLSFNTVETRKADLGRSLDDLNTYLGLAGLVALLLGSVGVAAGIHAHIRQKLETVAVLRCLGCSMSQTFAIYVLQAILIGLAGGLVGALLGIAVQRLFPVAIGDFLPFTVPLTTDWWSVVVALAQGLLISLLFALLPLLDVRRVPPLAAIRADYQPVRRVHHDPLVWLLYGLIAAGIVGLCALHSSSIRDGLVTAGGMTAAFLLLGGVARLLAAVVRRFTPKALPYVWRQGLANLHRPQNRTVLLMLSLGLGTFLVLLLYVVQGTLLKELISTRAGDRPNLALFDIQSDQKSAVIDMIRSRGLPVLDDAPVITMRLAEIKGRRVEDILTDTNRTTPNWVLRREYRSTYSDRLRGGERLISGKWPVKHSGDGPAPISLEQGIARDLGVKIGDEIVFDVQGILVPARIQSLREVDWRRVQPNFFVVFAPGVLNDAPATHVLVSRVETPAQSAELQRELVKAFPNVSAIDVTLILQSLDAIFSRISFAVRFMASFTVITGLVVLGASVLTGRYQRIRESVLLRSLGASRSQIFQILLAEYSCLGLLAACSGIVLALGTGWALAHFVLHLKFTPALWPIAAGLFIVTALTVLTGLLASRGVLNHPPLEVLRAE